MWVPKFYCVERRSRLAGSGKPAVLCRQDGSAPRRRERDVACPSDNKFTLAVILRLAARMVKAVITLARTGKLDRISVPPLDTWRGVGLW